MPIILTSAVAQLPTSGFLDNRPPFIPPWAPVVGEYSSWCVNALLEHDQNALSMLAM